MKRRDFIKNTAGASAGVAAALAIPLVGLASTEPAEPNTKLLKGWTFDVRHNGYNFGRYVHVHNQNGQGYFRVFFEEQIHAEGWTDDDLIEMTGEYWKEEMLRLEKERRYG
jgi:anaerobic selenocysteine-containing dehydrogenase